MTVKKIAENVVEEVPEMVEKTNKIDVKGLGVIVTVATGVIAAALFGIKKIREHKTNKIESEEVKTEDLVTEAKA